jgi:hypothetical protein
MRYVMQTIRRTVSQAEEQTGRQSAEKHLVLYNIYLSGIWIEYVSTIYILYLIICSIAQSGMIL